MRIARALHLAAWLFCAFGSPALAQSAGDTLHACEILQRGMHVEGATVYLPPGKETLRCWGFMSAVLEYAALADQNGKPMLGTCVGPDTTTVQVIRLFVAYANKHPEKPHLSATAVAYNAMADGTAIRPGRRHRRQQITEWLSWARERRDAFDFT